MLQDIKDKTILLVISGGIAAYKSLELIRLLKKAGASVRCILSRGGAHFITELSVSALSGEKTFTDLWSLTDETEMGHIRLSRESDLVVIAPASANMIARIAHGLADDLATTTLLANNRPVMFAPAMNGCMWDNPATQENIEILRRRGFVQIGPDDGEMACGETGLGRMAEPEEIFGAIIGFLSEEKPLSGKKALVTSGPTYEPLDPVRFIGNRSSGKQGHAIAAALAAAGADVTLITGPVALPDPAGVTSIHVETATEMLMATQNALPADIAVCAAAVSDWSPLAIKRQKIKKSHDSGPPEIKLKENPDILATIARRSPRRPALVIGFAAETENLLEAAAKKRKTKGCDWILANDVAEQEKVFGSDQNHVYLLSGSGTTEWPRGSKKEIAEKLALCVADYFKDKKKDERAEIAAS